MLINLVLVVGVLMVMFILYIRINLIFDIRLAWNITVFNYLKSINTNGTCLFNNDYDYMFNIIGSYYSMIFKFWCKNIEDFISKEDKQLYNQIIQLKRGLS